MTVIRALVFLGAALAASAFAAEPAKPQAVPGQTPSAQSPTPAPTGASLGRLFFSADERAAIDDSRRRPAVAVAPETKPLPPAPEQVTLNGVVRRSDGSTAIWLNNRMMIDGRRTADGVEVAESKRAQGAGSVTVRVPQAGRSVDLRVGQQLDVTSGKIKERYQVPPPPPAAPAPTSEAPSAEPQNMSARSMPTRRPSRERELRELIRDLEPAPVERQQQLPPDTRG